MRRVFTKLDRNQDGSLSRDEIIIAYKKYLNKMISDLELDRILAQVDSDMSGAISFSEFVVACIEPATLLTN